MGKQTTTANEIAYKVVSGQFTGTGQSSNANAGLNAGANPQPPVFKELFNASLWGTFIATVVLEKSFDGGANWVPVSEDSGGTANSFTAPCAVVVYEPETNILYRWNCTAFTSGTINYRISQ